MSFRPTALALAWLPLLLALPAPAESWYAQRITTGDAPLHIEYLWSDGPRLRAEAVIAGRPILTLVSGRRYVIVDRMARAGISIERSPAAVAADAGLERPFGDELHYLLALGAERVGTEQLAGRECERLRVTDPTGRRELCVTTDGARLPLEMTSWARANGQQVTMRYLDWTRGLELPAEFFEPEPHLKLEPVSYADYVARAGKELLGPAPVFFAPLLHGPR